MVKHFLLLISFTTIVLSQNYTKAPTIGVLTQESYAPEKYPIDQYVAVTASYVRWLESSGAKVVPIYHTSSFEEIKSVLSKVNGVLLQGGSMALNVGDQKTKFQEVNEFILNEALKMNQNGDFFPVWGTCLGFETLSIWASGNASILGNSTDFNRSHSISIENTNSQLFSIFTSEQQKYMQENPTFYYFHQYIVTPDSFYSSENFIKMFDATSFSSDINGKMFVNSIEGRTYPFYGIQFHPEKINFEWNYGFDINHQRFAVRISQALGNFFIDLAAKNQHKYDSYEEEMNSFIFNFSPVKGMAASRLEDYYLPINSTNSTIAINATNSTLKSFLE